MNSSSDASNSSDSSVHATPLTGAGTAAARDARIFPVRAPVGGLLMGFANIVPGISGGAMLLMVGVYQRFVEAVAECSTLRFRLRSIVFLALVALGAGTTILLSAGIIKRLILEHTWQALALFIGLRLGAIPIVWKWCKPFEGANARRVVMGVVGGLVVTGVLAITQYAGAGGGGGAHTSTALTRFAAGLAGASATILPGMDGSYFLLLMGEYVPILTGIERLKDALVLRDVGAIWQAGLFLVPVALGVALGLGGVSVLLRWLFAKHKHVVGGVLLGVVVGAVGGLWPFRESVPPAVGDVVKGTLVTAENIGSFDIGDWSTRFFAPSGVQIAVSVGLALLGFAIAWGFSKIDPEKE
jgi:putative membrane protein